MRSLPDNRLRLRVRESATEEEVGVGGYEETITRTSCKARHHI
jgi:hypothetical protein